MDDLAITINSELVGLTEFHLSVMKDYHFQDWAYQGWVIVPGSDYLGFKRGSEKSSLIAKIIFQKQGDDSSPICFAGVILTPNGENIDALVIDDPYKFQVRRWIYGIVPCYLEGATNIAEFLDIYNKYRK